MTSRSLMPVGAVTGIAISFQATASEMKMDWKRVGIPTPKRRTSGGSPAMLIFFTVTLSAAILTTTMIRS